MGQLSWKTLLAFFARCETARAAAEQAKSPVIQEDEANRSPPEGDDAGTFFFAVKSHIRPREFASRCDRNFADFAEES
ncbi:MAG: hypothetical protein DWQ31_01025 [Planctomycetota bacterium]|nr:MAG: hypothetical protein DWQ31_01025 [Planctomycetota bacterium]REJ92701.1 MAG: hypothetical protein DWQ35_11710 [Planctomycetota bacterium]REK23738.1 MAG: hypothetical protein DWQ42_14680 [Planctomycetota bacterium]REK47591.1 MAG: hypothetical protein DWQ46_03960 [Planctomycetota bacterium]